MREPGEARLLGERARKRCLDNYSMESIAQSLLKAVELALKSGPKSQPVLADK
jgi:hypothetical protein